MVLSKFILIYLIALNIPLRLLGSIHLVSLVQYEFEELYVVTFKRQ